MRRTANYLSAFCVAVGLAAGVVAQTPGIKPKPKVESPRNMTGSPDGVSPAPKADPNQAKNGTLRFQTSIGSFKTIDGYGRIEMSFRGSVLLSGYEGATPVVVGQIKTEYERPSKKAGVIYKRVYSGKGKIIVDGHWRAIQWFGKDLKAVWRGHGMIRLVGEFDKNLNTGTYTYDGNPKPFYWPTFITGVQLPEPRTPLNVEPQERKNVKASK